MIKRLLATFFIFICVSFFYTPLTTYAEQTPSLPNYLVTSVTYDYNADGSYLEVITSVEPNLASATGIYAKSASKAYNLYNSDGEKLWSFYVHGTFTVNPGVSATCTSTSYSTDIAASNWHLDGASTYASGNQAIGDATFIHKLLFITIETRTARVVLTCDSNGNCY